jgi:hypothetical protein
VEDRPVVKDNSNITEILTIVGIVAACLVVLVAGSLLVAKYAMSFQLNKISPESEMEKLNAKSA